MLTTAKKRILAVDPSGNLCELKRSSVKFKDGKPALKAGWRLATEPDVAAAEKRKAEADKKSKS